jgi:diguanylate cyclase (GGDEF)-like protein
MFATFRTSIRWLVLTVAVFLGGAMPCDAASLVVLAGTHHVDVLQAAEVAAGADSLSDVLSGRAVFVPFARFTPHGWPASVWIRFSVARALRADRPEWYLILPRWTESAELYRAGAAPVSTSMYAPIGQRPDDLEAPSFPILDRDYGGAPLLLHLTYYPDTDLGVLLMTRATYSRVVEPTLAIQSAFIGVLLAVGVLNLFVYLTTRSRSVFWYVVFIASLFFGELATSGIGDRYFWSALSLSSRLMTYAAQVVVSVTFFAFARSFLRTRSEAPALDRLMLGYVIVYAVLQTIQALVPGGSVLVPFVILVAISGMFIFVIAGIVRYRSGYKPARFFALGFLPVAIGMTASFTYQIVQAPLDSPWFWAFNGGELGIMVQTIVLSFAVADRMRTLEIGMQSMESLAHADTLTGLANRAWFTTELDERVAHAGPAESFAVLFCDLDGFKEVNDVYGHPAGDEVLRIVARRLLGCLRSTDVVARIGGDEFAVLLKGTAQEQVDPIAKTLEAVLDDPIVVEGSAMPLGISIGRALFPRDGKTTAELLAFADQRMYENKQRHKVGSAGSVDRLPPSRTAPTRKTRK